MIYLSIYFLGASAYGVCNNNILAIVSNNIGKLCTIVLKSANKRLTTKEKELQEDKKMKKKQKSDLQRAKKNRKNGKFDDEEDEDEGGSDSDSEAENPDDKETYSQFTQLSQSSQPFDEEEEIEVNPFLNEHHMLYINLFPFNYLFLMRNLTSIC